MNPEEVQLRDCQGDHLHAEGHRTVSLVVQDESGEEAKLEHSFLIANVKSISSLGQLYRSGWSLKQLEHRPVLESSDQELRVPVAYQGKSLLAINVSVCRVEMVKEEVLSPHAHVRERLRPSSPRNNQWLVGDGNPYVNKIGDRLFLHHPQHLLVGVASHSLPRPFDLHQVLV